MTIAFILDLEDPFILQRFSVLLAAPSDHMLVVMQGIDLLSYSFLLLVLVLMNLYFMKLFWFTSYGRK